MTQFNPASGGELSMLSRKGPCGVANTRWRSPSQSDPAAPRGQPGSDQPSMQQFQEMQPQGLSSQATVPLPKPQVPNQPVRLAGMGKIRPQVRAISPASLDSGSRAIASEILAYCARYSRFRLRNSCAKPVKSRTGSRCSASAPCRTLFLPAHAGVVRDRSDRLNSDFWGRGYPKFGRFVAWPVKFN